MNDKKDLLIRSNGQCELCGHNDKQDLMAFKVTPKEDSILWCSACQEKSVSPQEHLQHWRCLGDSMWSEYPAVQVQSWRLLKQLQSYDWASDLVRQLYLDDDLIEWAQTGQGSNKPTVDSNGNSLHTGDTVTLIKDLTVKGAGFTAKRGTTVKKISLTDNPLHIEGKVNGIQVVLVTSYLKKVLT